MNTSYTAGKNCIINETASIGKNVVFGHNCIIEANVQIGDYLHGFCYGGGISDWASSNNSRKIQNW